MSGYRVTTPGGVWHNVNTKALSYGYIRQMGFGGAMATAGACGGSLRNAVLNHHIPMVRALPFPEGSAYFQAAPHMQGSGIMNVLKMIGSNLIGPFKDIGNALLGR